MKTLFIVLLIVSGIVFVTSVLLMSPKGGIGFGIGGAGASSNEYGSKKSVETSLKKAALISGIIFGVVALFLPYVK